VLVVLDTAIHFRTPTSLGVYFVQARKSVTQDFSTRRPNFPARGWTAQVFALIGRSLLILTTVSFISMPVTEHFWTWDHCLRGGDDFELCALLVLSILCLVLVLSKHGRQGVYSLFANWCLLAFIFNQRQLVRAPMRGIFLILLEERFPSRDLAMYSLPLQI
jgi:hypothetical protein